MCHYMIKTSSFLSREPSVTFGNIHNLRKFLKVSERSSGFRQNLVKSDRKSSENRLHEHVYIICSLVRYQVKHSKRNSISTRTIVLSSIYFVRPKYSCMYSCCEMQFCSQTWHKALVLASAHNCVRYMLLLPGSLILSYLLSQGFLPFVGETSNYLANGLYTVK